MALIISQATANESPDATQGGTLAVTGNDNTSHGSTTSTVSAGPEESLSQIKTCRWLTFPAAFGQVSAITLKFNWSISGSLVLTGVNQGTTTANALWRLQYSTDGGSNWTTALERTFSRITSGTTNISDSGSETVTLPIVALGQIQVRDRIGADASSTGDPVVSEASTIAATIDTIQLEVTTVDASLLVMM